MQRRSTRRVAALAVAGVALAATAFVLTRGDEPSGGPVYATTAGVLLDAELREVGRLPVGPDGPSDEPGDGLEVGEVLGDVARDGRLVYISDREATQTVGCCGSEGPDKVVIFVSDRDGGNERRLVDVGPMAARAVSTYPDWSPDARSVTFSKGDGGAVYVYDLARASVRVLAAGPSYASPDWSPTRDLIAVTTWEGPPSGRHGIVMLDGSSGTVVATVPKAGAAPFAWSPDGTRLAYTVPAEPGRPGGIAVYDVDRGTSRVIPRTGTVSRSPLVWGDDGLLMHLSRGGGRSVIAVSADGVAEPVTVRRCDQREDECHRPSIVLPS